MTIPRSRSTEFTRRVIAAIIGGLLGGLTSYVDLVPAVVKFTRSSFRHISTNTVRLLDKFLAVRRVSKRVYSRGPGKRYKLVMTRTKCGVSRAKDMTNRPGVWKGKSSKLRR